jgi:hypothetical protein
MAESGRTDLPVAERDRPGVPVGSIGLEQLLAGRLQDLKEERHRSRPLRPIQMIGRRRAAAEAVGR